jgi:hypothetical protein
LDSHSSVNIEVLWNKTLYSSGNTYNTMHELNGSIFMATLPATNTVMRLLYNIKQTHRKNLLVMLGFIIITT